jgi:hypothetical protein
MKVTCIDLDGDSDAAQDVRARGALVIEGDATQMNTLANAAAGHAAYVVCACHQDSTNAAIATQVAELAKKRRRVRVTVFVHISDPQLHGLLRTLSLGLEHVRLQFFNIYDLWARALVDEAHFDQLASGADEEPKVVVIGSTALGLSVVVAAAHRWHDIRGDASHHMQIELVAADAKGHCATLAARYPALAGCAELVPVDDVTSPSGELEVAPLVAAANNASTTVYACLYDDAENLSVALKAQHELPLGARVIVPATAWTGELASLLLDMPGGIHAVGYSEEPDSFDLLRDNTREAMARQIHANYLADGEASQEANRPWEELPENLRESNRQQADAIIRHLHALWYEHVPLYDWNEPPVALPAAEVEKLAELEHIRWCNEKLSMGYQHGPKRIDQGSDKRHPDLVSWNELSETARNKDRSAVRKWPGVLYPAGFTLRRNAARERLAELIHDRHRADVIAAGSPEASNPSMLPWSQLDDELRDANRASADDIAVKLARIGCSLIPAGSEAPAFAFSDEELESLAELEHERWRAVKEAQGWRLGSPRDDEAKLHPDLVPWEELPEETREIDRQHVRAIPELVSLLALRVARLEQLPPSDAATSRHKWHARRLLDPRKR